MNFILVGAGGFVGTALAASLGRAGHSVRTLSLRAGLPDEAALRPVLEAAQCVVHLAAHNPPRLSPGFGRADAFDAVNHRLAAAAATAVRDAGNARFLYVSSARVYGTPTSAEPLGEAAPTDARDAYGRSKIAAEAALGQVFAAQPDRLVVFRPPVIYGPGRGGVPGLMARWGRAGWPVPVRFDTAVKSVLSIGNFCDAVAVAAASGMPAGTYNLADDAPLSLGAMADLFSTRARGRALKRIPLAALQGAALAVMPQALRHAMAPLVLDCSAFRAQSGWHPRETPFEAIPAAFA